MNEDLTFLIITSLNDTQVEKTLANINGLAKILLVDGGARKKSHVPAQENDYVKNLAELYDAEYSKFHFENAAKSYNFGLDRVSSEYVFVLDSDEILDGNLREWISGGKYRQGEVFRVKRINYFLGEPLKYGLLRPDWNIRLFRTGTARYENREVHARVLTTKKINRAPGVLHHYTYTNVEALIERLRDYSAREILAREKSNSQIEAKGKLRNMFLKLPFQGMFRFIYNYILRLGILDGKRGFHFAAISLYYELLVAMRRTYD